jgi:type VI secretion system secreted protein VgrG
MVGPNILQKGVTAAMAVMRNKLRDVMTDNLGKFTDMLGFLAPDTMGEGNLVIGVGKNKAETVMVSSSEIVGAAKASTIGGGYQLTVGGVKNESVAVGSWEEVGQTKVTVVGHKYEIVCGKSRIMLERDGTITLEGVKLVINEQERMTVKAGKIELN